MLTMVVVEVSMVITVVPRMVMGVMVVAVMMATMVVAMPSVTAVTAVASATWGVATRAYPVEDECPLHNEKKYIQITS